MIRWLCRVKKSRKSCCENYRCISPVSAASKLPISIIFTGLLSAHKGRTEEDHAGIQPGRCSLEHTFVRYLLVCRRKFCGLTTSGFLLLKAALDSLSRALFSFISDWRVYDRNSLQVSSLCMWTVGADFVFMAMFSLSPLGRMVILRVALFHLLFSIL